MAVNPLVRGISMELVLLAAFKPFLFAFFYNCCYPAIIDNHAVSHLHQKYTVIQVDRHWHFQLLEFEHPRPSFLKYGFLNVPSQLMQTTTSSVRLSQAEYIVLPQYGHVQLTITLPPPFLVPVYSHPILPLW